MMPLATTALFSIQTDLNDPGSQDEQRPTPEILLDQDLPGDEWVCHQDAGNIAQLIRTKAAEETRLRPGELIRRELVAAHGATAIV
jgi:hypothetical protein